MRAVYVLKEMPTKCMDCPFHQFIAFGLTAETHCVLVAKKNEDGINTKAEWCPLKPLPEKGTMDNIEPCAYNEGFVDGRNHCIELITGETERSPYS